MEGKKKDMKKGIFLAPIVCLLLLSSYAYADIQCGCNQCHGNPPIVNTFGGPDGLAGVGFTTGAHLAHTGTTFGGAESPVCYKCHSNGMPFSPVCGNTKLQMGFNINGGSGVGTIYDGTTLNPSWTYNGNNGTTITQNGSMKCSNIYCHSNGTGGTQNTGASGSLPPLNDPRTVASGTSPAWNTLTTIGCNACHGAGTTDGRPSYAQDQPKSNSHLLTEHASLSCDTCHYATTHDGGSIFDVTKHANGTYDVAPNPNTIAYGRPVNFVYTYDPGGGTCVATSCHGGGQTPFTWGNPNSFVQVNPYAGPVSYEVEFSGAPGNAVSCNWDFGDGTGSTDCLADHVYSSKGPYVVTLNGRDQNYHIYSGSATANPLPVNLPPVALISNLNVTANTWTVSLTDASTDAAAFPANAIRVTWGDGYSSTGNAGAAFSHTYTAAGTYPITLSVTDAGGLSNSTTASSGPLSTFTISGTVTGASPNVNNVLVSLKSGATVVGSTYTPTSGTGTYSFTNVKPGTYTVVPSKSGVTFNPQASGSVTVGPSASGVDFAASGTATTKYSIAVTTSPVVSGATITVKNSSGTIVAQGTTNAGGTYMTATTMSNGTYSVQAYKYGVLNSTKPVTIADANASVSFP